MMRCREIHLECVDSTNTYAKNHSQNFDAKEVTCIIAEQQTAGRGRFQRTWISPPGVNLYVTFYFQLPSNAVHLGSLAQVMTCSFASVLQAEGLSPSIKWPNDVRLGGKKISGVLCETVFHPAKVDVILGIGINVNMEKKDLDRIDQPAASLRCETNHMWDKKEVLKKLQKQFLHDLELFRTHGFVPFRTFFESLLAYRGEKIRCSDGKNDWVGICHSITEDGRLNLLIEGNTLHTLSSGDIL